MVECGRPTQETKEEEEEEKGRRRQNGPLGHMFSSHAQEQGEEEEGSCKDWEVEGVWSVKLLDMPNRQGASYYDFFIAPLGV